MRYVMKYEEDQFIRFIQWTAGVVPHFSTDRFDNAMIVDDEYLNRRIENINRTRREAITEKYPKVDFLEVEVKLKD